MRSLAFGLASICLALSAATTWSAEELPADAKDLIAIYEKDLAAIQKKAEEEKKARRTALTDSLEKLQVQYTKAGDLDRAVAIRDLVRALKAGAYGTEPGPTNLTGYRDQVGKVLFFEVVGDVAGTLYGSDIYTDDSPLAAAAVHAGVLKNGQKGVVKVTILPGRAEYQASSRNGKSSVSWYSHGGSYQVESLDGKPSDAKPADPKPAGGTGLDDAVKKAKDLITPALDKVR